LINNTRGQQLLIETGGRAREKERLRGKKEMIGGAPK